MSAIRVIQFTDPHLFGDAAGTLRGVNTLETLERTLADASGHLAIADAILITGDLVQDDPGGYEPFRRLFARFGKPVLCIPGNHDLVPQMRAALSGRPFELDGPADIGAWRIVLLDSVVPDQAGGRISVEMLTKLDEELGMARQRHALVCLHHHPVAMNSRWLDNVGLSNANEFWSVIDSHPQVRAVVWGHVHQAFEGTRRGVRLLATPSTCAQFQPRSDQFVIDNQPPAYRLLTLQFQRRHRHWRALPDCRRIRGMTFHELMRRGLARGLAALLLLASLGGLARADGGSAVWTVKGQRNTVYLAGSVHALPKDHAQFSPQLELAYGAADAIVMEVDLDDLNPLEAVQFLATERHAAQRRRPSRMSSARTSTRRWPGSPIRSICPRWPSRASSPGPRPWCSRNSRWMKTGYDPQLGIDMQLTERARADGKPIEGLETIGDQLGIFDSRSQQEQISFLLDAAEDVPEMQQDLDRLIAAWRTGDLRALESEFRRSAPRRRRSTTNC